MKYGLLLFGWICFMPSIRAQLSSRDIRQAAGKGPYPLYINYQYVFPCCQDLFKEFRDVYVQEKYVKDKKMLNGFEANLGIMLNDRHFLGIRNWRVNSVMIEAGYRFLFRNLTGDHPIRLHLQEEVFSIRLGTRYNPLYPVTTQLQIGPSLYNFYVATEYDDNNGASLKYRFGNGALERNRDKRKTCAGLDLRGRLMFLDPAGTEGGIGFYFDYRYQFTFGKRDFNGLFNDLLPGVEPVRISKNWNYGAFSIGVVASLALPMPSIQ